MGQLCIYLPPFAADYSGVCSALFDLRCLTAINDASCCSGHYVHYDEPRWSYEPHPVFCTSLRNIDAILGNDDLVVQNVSQAMQSIEAPLAAVVGTPVPAITGMDMVGIAGEVEQLTGKPTLGFNTTGFAYYDKGIVSAGKELIRRFACGNDACASQGSSTDGAKAPGASQGHRVNIIGMTPLDYGCTGNAQDVVALLESAGWQVVCNLFMGLDMAQLSEMGAADVNLAVSASGVQLAKALHREFQTPYVASFPLGSADGASAQNLLRTLEAAASGAIAPATEGLCAPAQGEDRQGETPARSDGDGRILIVHDQVIANSLRAHLRLRGEQRAIDVASFFGWSPALAEPGDLPLKKEAAYLGLLRSGAYETLFADPLLLEIPPAEGIPERIPLVHPAVSSKLHWSDAPRLRDF